MTRARYTPGPWRQSRLRGPDLFVEDYDPFVTIHTGDDGTGAVATAWNDANARLIAAAPDLVEVVQRVVRGCLTSSEGQFDPVTLCRHCGAEVGGIIDHWPECVVVLARAALQKAGVEP